MDQEREGMEAGDGFPWGLWASVALLAVATFAAGFLTGVISDGNAEILHDFQRRTSTAPVVLSRAATSAIDASPTRTPAPSGADVAPDRPANGSVQWSLKIAPGVPVRPIEMRNADLDDDARIDFGLVYNGQVQTMATVSVRAGETARLSLPEGRYSMRATPVPTGGDPAKEPQIVDGTLLVPHAQEAPLASLNGSRDGSWRIVPPSARQEAAKAASPKRRRRTSAQAEYDGLGESARDGGSPTYSPGA